MNLVGAGFSLRKKNLNAICGFVLLEVLIAVFILTFGLLGITGLYINSLKRTKYAYFRSIATSQLVAGVEQQKAFDHDHSKWIKECESLLPQGECKCDAGKIIVCWKEQHVKQCL